MWINITPQADVAWMVALRRIDVATVELALHRWVQDVQRGLRSTSLPVLDGLTVMPPEELYAPEILQRSIASVPFSHTALSWMVAAAMQAEALQTGVPAKLDITSEGELVTWDNAIVAQSDSAQAIAMHAIVPMPMRISGYDAITLCVRAHMVHVPAHWRQSIDHVLVKRGKCVLKLDIQRSRREDGSWQTTYRRGLDRLVESIGTAPLPSLEEVDVSLGSPVRPLCKHVPKSSLIGQGCGPLFLDQACWHLRKTVPSTRPVIVDRVVSSLKRPPLSVADRVARSAIIGPVLVLTSEATTALRLDAAARTLAGGSRSLDPTQPARFDLQYLVPARAREMLCEPVDPGVLKVWFDTHVRAELTRRGTKFAIIETAPAVASDAADRDSKFPLRIFFARCGVTTQFIFNMPAPEPDYPAQGCLFDVVRQSGHLPQPLPRLPSLPAATTVIGVYVDKIRIGATDALVPVITRARLGEDRAELFVANKKGARGKWLSYHEGICATYAVADLLSPEQVSQFVQQALAVPTNVLDEPLIVYLHSNLKRIYSGINDRVGLASPQVGNVGTWIVRVHAGPDTVQISGDETVHPCEPGYVGEKIGLYRTAGAVPAYFFVSPSKHYRRVISQRHNTRFDTTTRGLRDPWHQLGVSQFNVVKRGTFSTESAVLEQTALLCKKAPTWDGEIRLPAPLHLAMQVAKDHPAIAMQRRAFA